MPKYVLADHGGSMPETKEERGKVMAAWGAWMGGLGDALVDGGNPVGQSATVNADGSISQDGGSNPLSGYSLLNADNQEAALKAASGCPILQRGGSVEVAEAIEM